MIQETWEEGDLFDIEIGSYHIFCHNCSSGDTGRERLFKGVAIGLDPEYYQAWKRAGSPPPNTTKADDAFPGRFISITVNSKTLTIMAG